MSIGIAYTLQDRVLLVTDNRSVKGFNQADETISDEAEKIHGISPRIAAIGVGIEQGIKIAVDLLKVSVNENSSLDRITDAVEACLEAGWIGLKKSVASDVDITAPYFKIGLLVAGVAQNRVFAAAMIRSHKFKTPLVVNTNDYDGIMLGMDSFEISERFAARAGEIVTVHQNSTNKNNNDGLTAKILSLAQATIGQIAGDNKLISKETTHTVIRK